MPNGVIPQNGLLTGTEYKQSGKASLSQAQTAIQTIEANAQEVLMVI
jgi:hypothetical protein